MNSKFYKYCAVPMCKSTVISTPEKLFIHVPKDRQVRRKWLTLARRDPATLSVTTTSYFCEDHFDLPNDMDNYMEYTIMGMVSRINMREGCLPTKFACQPNRPCNTAALSRPVAVKRQRKAIIEELEKIRTPSRKSKYLCIDIPGTSSGAAAMAEIIVKEEHDVIDNPDVMTIFPDVTLVKQEVKQEIVIPDIEEEQSLLCENRSSKSRIGRTNDELTRSPKREVIVDINPDYINFMKLNEEVDLGSSVIDGEQDVKAASLVDSTPTTDIPDCTDNSSRRNLTQKFTKGIPPPKKKPKLFKERRNIHKKNEKSLLIPRKLAAKNTESLPSTSMTNINVNMAKNTLSMTPRKKRLSHLREHKRKNLAALRAKCRRFKTKNAELSEVIYELKSKNLINEETGVLLSSIIFNNTDYLQANKTKYPPELRRFALSLHFISPRAYNFVRRTFKTCLPHTLILARWYLTVGAEPGFSKESLETLKLLVYNNKDKKWICALSFNEMPIRRSVQWDGNFHVGYVDFGNHLDSDIQPVAKEALVFMITALNGSWKLPVGYFLIDSITAEQKASLVKTCIDLLNECGLDIVSVTFDGCPANFSMAKLLGHDIEGGILNPVFKHRMKNIVLFPDPSDMLKLVRNALKDESFLKNQEGEVISSSYVDKLVELEENEGFHLDNKLRNAHINFRKQMMNLKLGSQLFSESVADVIECCRKDLHLEQFEKSESTIEFIRKFNSLFDILNSRNMKSYGYKKPLSENNYDDIKEFLDNTYAYIKSLYLGSFNILKTNRKTGFLGFLVCIKSVLFLYENLVKTGKIDFISTYKLSLDHMEIFFSAIRAKGGFNNNPTATQFKAKFKRLLIHGDLKHLTSGNCFPLTDINILAYCWPEIAINASSDRNRLIEKDEEMFTSLNNEVVISNDHGYIADPTRLPEFSKQILTYIAGFVVKKLESQLKCEHCLSYLWSNKKLCGTFYYRKDIGGLCNPSDDVIKICEIAEEAYRRNKIIDKENYLHFLLQNCLEKCIGISLFTESNHFVDITHYSLLIKAICKKYLNVRIHYAPRSMKNIDNIRNIYSRDHVRLYTTSIS